MEDAKNLTQLVTSVVLCVAVVAFLVYVSLTARRVVRDNGELNERMKRHLDREERRDAEGEDWRGDDDAN